MRAIPRHFTVAAALFLTMVGPGRANEKPAAQAKAEQAATPAAATSPAVANSECMDCHEAEFKPRKKGLAPEWIGVKPEVFAHSAHGKLNCVDCHSSITETPHPSKLPAVDCASCHTKALSKHAFHARLLQTPIPKGKDTSCAECHGNHDTIARKSKEFAFTDGRQTEACGRCHEPERADYFASAHGAHPTEGKRIAPD